MCGIVTFSTAAKINGVRRASRAGAEPETSVTVAHDKLPGTRLVEVGQQQN